MSRRTAEANKAIAAAWKREQQLVKEGKGTRDWTQDQQREIIERGNAHDENKKAFEGHHMRNAETYPECQGDPDNIQFLTKEEHLAAHDGCWKNPTNWYYNPITKEKLDFGNGPIIPCEAKNLTNPVIYMGDAGLSEENTITEAIDKEAQEKKLVSNKAPGTQNDFKQSLIRNIVEGGKKFGKGAKQFWDNNKGPIKSIGAALVFGVIGECISNHYGDGAGGGSFRNSFDYDYDDSNENDFDERNHWDDESSSNNTFNDSCDDSAFAERNYPENRQSPREHNVNAHWRCVNGKMYPVRGYPRGGRKTDDEQE